MIDFLSPLENYSAEDYRSDAMNVLRDIESRGKGALFVGGTGLYMDTVIRGAALVSPPSSEEVKAELLSHTATEEEREALWHRLCEVDPESAEKTHKNNVRRVIRALEIYELTGKTKTYFDSLTKVESPDVRVGMITLDFHNRDNLYKRVDMRVDQMMEEGLLAEVSALYEGGILKKGTTAAQAIGYKEIISYIDGECTLDEAVEFLKLSTRRYAKRQLTWFRHNTDAKRLYVDREDGTMKTGDELLSELFAMADELIENAKE
jgi:tRNA dimethylallyltransferase